MSLLLEALKKAETAKRGKTADSSKSRMAGEKPAPGDAGLALEMPAPPSAPLPEPELVTDETDLAFPEISLGDMEPPEPPPAPQEAIPAETVAPMAVPQPKPETQPVLSLDFPEASPPSVAVIVEPMPPARPEPLVLAAESPAQESPEAPPAQQQAQPEPSIAPPAAVPSEALRVQTEPAPSAPPADGADKSSATSQATAKKILAAKQDKPKRNLKLLGGILGISMLAGAAIAYYYWQALTQTGLAPAPVRPRPAVTPPAAPQQPAAPAVTEAGHAGVGGAPANAPTPAVAEKSADKPTTPAPLEKTSLARNKPAPSSTHPEREAEPAPGTQRSALSPSLPSRDNGIRIYRDNDEAKLDPLLTSAYQAFMAGDSGKAERDYRKALQQTPNSRDALLGLAAIAASRGQAQEAASQYLRVLQLDPKDAAAQAGLIGLRGYSDPTLSESRLKTLLAQNPDVAYLHFALGNLYASQSRWPEAQEAYFNALHSDSGNADYAFNLAVSLEHLDQRQPALAYYQRALTLVKQRPASFDSEQLKRRIHELQASN